MNALHPRMICLGSHTAIAATRDANREIPKLKQINLVERGQLDRLGDFFKLIV